MAKRLTDTEKWKKSFIRSLQAPYKLLWLYILDECNHAGIWEVEIDVAQARIGEELNLETAVKQYGDRIQVFDDGRKWFIPDFLDFQYGQLQEDNRVHKSVFAVLGRYGLKQNKELGNSLQGDKDKDKDQAKDKVKAKDKNPIHPFSEFWTAYPKKVDKAEAYAIWFKMPPEDQAACLTDLPLRVRSKAWVEEGGKFIWSPARHLRKRKWEDELETKPLSNQPKRVKVGDTWYDTEEAQ